MPVPIMNPRAQYEGLEQELRERMDAVVDSGQFVLGPNVAGFEREAAEYLGVKHAIGVANGTDALVLALRALDIGAGDEVICPAYTFYATNEAISAVGAKPVFADVDDVTYTLDIEAVRRAISGATKAIMPVHLFGQCADIEQLRSLAAEHGLAIIEDAAQAFGAAYQGRKAGSLGDVATFSFFPTKNLPCFGDGGMVATNRDDIADMVRQLRFHGSRDKKTFTHIGYNSRLDELQAVVLRLFLTKIDEWNAARQSVAARYIEAGLSAVVGVPAVADDRDHIYHVYMARSEHRDAIAAACRERGVGCNVYYNPPSHLQPVYESLGWAPGDLPVSEAMASQGIALPMFPTMSDSEIDQVVAAVRAAVPVAVSS